MTEIKIHTLDEARDAMRQIAAACNTSLTGISDAAGISKGTTHRFVAKLRRAGQKNDVDIQLNSLLRFVNFAEWEIVARPRDTRAVRERRRDAIRKANGGS